MADVSMVDDNDDNWLYGDSNPDGPENEAEKLPNGDSNPAAPVRKYFFKIVQLSSNKL